MSRVRTFIIGMNPSAQERVFKNSALDRLRTWCHYLKCSEYYFLNCSRVPGVFNKDTVDTDILRESINDDDCVIALGEVPHDILNGLKIKNHKMPHPSPRNRLLNDPEFERDALDRCREYIREHYDADRKDLHTDLQTG